MYTMMFVGFCQREATKRLVRFWFVIFHTGKLYTIYYLYTLWAGCVCYVYTQTNQNNIWSFTNIPIYAHVQAHT